MTSFVNVICVPNFRRATGTLRFVLPLLVIGLAGSLDAQTLTNLGAVAPTPGTNDISQLSTQGNQTFPDGKNYYTDNNPPTGQTFTTGTNAMKLVSVAIKTAGLDSGGGYGTPATTPTYYLSIFSVSNGEPRVHRRQLAKMEWAECATGHEQNLSVYFRQTANWWWLRGDGGGDERLRRRRDGAGSHRRWPYNHRQHPQV